eukprot:GHVU01022828.1.p2 GENE.GHVU01022828.1~~GHVU01022828.1.p2  ORF type:complete len:203 (-),score=19.24 GHVU01022828.1:263-841(-)
MAVDGFATWWSLVIYKALDMVTSVQKIVPAENQGPEPPSSKPVADRFYFSQARMRCGPDSTGKEEDALITRTFFFGSSSAFDMVWMALSYALKHQAATLEAETVKPKDVYTDHHNKRHGGCSPAAGFDALIVPTYINGFGFCMNPNFIKCLVTDTERSYLSGRTTEVIPMKTALLNRGVVRHGRSKCAVAFT